MPVTLRSSLVCYYTRFNCCVMKLVHEGMWK